MSPRPLQRVGREGAEPARCHGRRPGGADARPSFKAPYLLRFVCLRRGEGRAPPGQAPASRLARPALRTSPRAAAWHMATENAKTANQPADISTESTRSEGSGAFRL